MGEVTPFPGYEDVVMECRVCGRYNAWEVHAYTQDAKRCVLAYLICGNCGVRYPINFADPPWEKK